MNEVTTGFERATPNVTMNYLDNRFEGEFYLWYYKAILTEGGSGSEGAINCDHSGGMNRLGPAQAGNRSIWDRVHYWLSAGVRVNSIWSMGAHYEDLLTTRDSSAPGPAQDDYRWVGPYVEMKRPGNMAFRFTVGKDPTDNQDFYKLNVPRPVDSGQPREAREEKGCPSNLEFPDAKEARS